MIILFRSLSTLEADLLFASNEDGFVMLDAMAYDTLSLVANEALGGERNDPKDYAWRFYDNGDCYGMHRLAESWGVPDDQALCAVATIGDREIVFTCDC